MMPLLLACDLFEDNYLIVKPGTYQVTESTVFSVCIYALDGYEVDY